MNDRLCDLAAEVFGLESSTEEEPEFELREAPQFTAAGDVVSDTENHESDGLPALARCDAAEQESSQEA
jgi:hypothetical protein